MPTPVADTLCPGCFADQGDAHPCPHCGYDERAPRGPLPLPHRAFLDGKFIVGRVLGKPGGFGITYLGWDLSLQTRVALKEYLPRDLVGRDRDRSTVAAHSAEDGVLFRYGLEQFLREARTLAQLDHPNIVRVRHFFEDHGTAYLVMDYYPGYTLAEQLDRQGGRLAEGPAVQLLRPILDGLRAVHAKGFLHRDVKPQNIYLARLDSGNLRPILIDFGAARQALSERSRSVSEVLTPGYAPYEQYKGKGRQGTWTDVYAVAATFYRTVTGEPPPPAPDRRDGEPLRPATAFGVGRRLTDALDAGLAMDVEKRPQTIQAFQARLPTGDEPVPPPPSPVPARSGWPVAVGAGLLLLGLGGGYLYHEVRNGGAGRETAAEREAVERAQAAETARQDQAAQEAAAAMHRAADDRAYAVARGTDTEPAYRSYLGGCAADGCGHRREAEERLVALATAAARAADQARLAEAQREAAAARLAAGPVVDAARDTVRLPVGRFLMGSPDSEPERGSDEGPQHWVQVPAFELGRHEVTFAQWDACVEAGGCTHKPKDEGWGRGQRPVINVSWNDAQEYVRWLSGRTGESWRLPTEAEWEYAARAGTTTPFSTGHCITSNQANYNGALFAYKGCKAKAGVYVVKTQPVKSYPANPWGLYDMHGNVDEWVEDCWHDSYTGAPTDGSAWTQGSCQHQYRVKRGGSWGVHPWSQRSASRDVSVPDNRVNWIGFRVARTLTP
jgi:formylglycine-generating enzyme required for sulfatase activity/serine/threonine protein kinase